MKRMTLIRRKINPKYDPYLAFAIAFGIAMLSFGIISLLPGGSRLPIISDLKSEYYVFLMAARKTILSGESLQYSWNIGMGLGTVGTFVYYSASPLHLLLLILPESWVIFGITLTIAIKFGLSAAAFQIYARRCLGQKGIETVVFGLFYGLCTYAVTYYFNIMWLDALWLMPLIIMYMEKMIKKKKMTGFVLSLFILFLSNYYISFLTGVFIFIYFCGFLILTSGKLRKMCIRDSYCAILPQRHYTPL